MEGPPRSRWVCNAAGSGFGACAGEAGPTDEVCNPFGKAAVGEDCDGMAEEGCLWRAGTLFAIVRPGRSCSG